MKAYFGGPGTQVIRDSKGDLVVDEGDGIVLNHKSGDLTVQNGADYQTVSSEHGTVKVDDAKLELHNTIAHKIIEVTDEGEDPVIDNIRYLSNEIIDSTSPVEQAQHLHTIRQYVSANVKWLDRAGRLSTLDWLTDILEIPL